MNRTLSSGRIRPRPRLEREDEPPPRYTEAAREIARQTLRREIEAAKAEAARAPLFKGRANEFQ